MAQIVPIVSEALEAAIRRLLPSQRGFGEDLQAQNVIVPVIDITPAAEGTQLASYLQQANSYTDAITFNVSNTNTTVTATPGFYRIAGAFVGHTSTTSAVEGKIQLDLGGTKKVLFDYGFRAINTETSAIIPFDHVIFVEPGVGLEVNTNIGIASMIGNARQIADVYGNLKVPTGLQVQ